LHSEDLESRESRLAPIAAGIVVERADHLITLSVAR